MLLLHGLPSPAGDMQKLGEALGGGRRLLVPRLPGYEGAPLAPGRQGVAAIEDALVEMLRSEGLTEVALVGFSMGGYRALSLALRSEIHPTAVVTLGGFAALSGEERAGMKGFAGALRAGHDIRAVAGPRFLSAAFREQHPEQIAEVESWLAVAPAEVLIAELEDVAESPSLLSRLSTLTCPVLAIAGGEDVAVPPLHSHQIAGAVPGGKLAIIAGSGHALVTEALAPVAAAIAGLLGG